MLTESGLTCWICNAYVQGEIGTHLAKAHYASLIWAWKTPRFVNGVEWLCTECVESKNQERYSSEEYVVHSAIVYDSLHKMCINENIDLVHKIREANIRKAIRSGAGRKILAKNAAGVNQVEAEIDSCTQRHGNSTINIRPELKTNREEMLSRAERQRIQQKIRSSTPMTSQEIKALIREIPVRSATSEEKEEMANAVSKIHTKLHLLYTMGIRNVPEHYLFNRKNFN
jgi:hypothetical protein